MKLLRINMNEIKSEAEVHRYLASELDFPAHYGENLDALFDVLTSELKENACVEFIGCEDESSPMYKFSEGLQRVLEDAAQTIEEKEGAMYAVLADTQPVDFKSFW